MGNGAPIPSFPHPPNYRDGAGMGTWYEKTLGIFWGRGWVENWVFLGFYPRKSPQKIWGYFRDGANFNFGDFWGFIPNKLQILGMGTGIISTSGIFGVFSPISLICQKLTIKCKVVGTKGGLGSTCPPTFQKFLLTIISAWMQLHSWIEPHSLSVINWVSD